MRIVHFCFSFPGGMRLSRTTILASCKNTYWLILICFGKLGIFSTLENQFDLTCFAFFYRSPRKVAASPTTPRFLSPTAQRNSFNSFFTSTVSFCSARDGQWKQTNVWPLCSFAIRMDLMSSHGIVCISLNSAPRNLQRWGAVQGGQHARRVHRRHCWKQSSHALSICMSAFMFIVN